jgi:hypothetical protein
MGEGLDRHRPEERAPSWRGSRGASGSGVLRLSERRANVAPAMAWDESVDWVRAPIKRCLEFVWDARRILGLSLRGINQSTSIELIEAVANLERLDDSGEEAENARQRMLTEARALATFAREQVAQGHPLLHAHTTVALWTSLEVMIEDLLVAWLINKPEALQAPAFKAIRVHVAEYERLDKEDRIRLLIQELERATNAAYKQGVGRFEIILQGIGLDGAIEEDTRKTLYELSHVRNLIVHRSGLVDRRFMESCPWLDSTIGTDFVVSPQKFLEYFMAVSDYVTTLINRLRVVFGSLPYTPASKAQTTSEESQQAQESLQQRSIHQPDATGSEDSTHV